MKLIDMINNSIQIEKNIKQPKTKPKKRKKQAKELGDTKSQKFSEV